MKLPKDKRHDIEENNLIHARARVVYGFKSHVDREKKLILI